MKDVLGAHRRQTESREPNARNKMTVGEAIAVYEETPDSNPALKPNAKRYRQKCLRVLLQSWPDPAEAGGPATSPPHFRGTHAITRRVAG